MVTNGSAAKPMSTAQMLRESVKMQKRLRNLYKPSIPVRDGYDRVLAFWAQRDFQRDSQP